MINIGTEKDSEIVDRNFFSLLLQHTNPTKGHDYQQNQPQNKEPR